MNKFLDIFSKIQMEKMNVCRADKLINEFKVGDTIKVTYKIVENGKIEQTKPGGSGESHDRTQIMQGVCIAKKNNNISSTFTVRKIFEEDTSYQRIFMLYSPIIEAIEVIKRGKVRRAKLFYLKTLYGKAARIKEDKSRITKA